MISLQETLFAQAEVVAREMHISRSRLFALALEEFIRRQENRSLLERINLAYDTPATSEEVALQQHARQQRRQLVEGEW